MRFCNISIHPMSFTKKIFLWPFKPDFMYFQNDIGCDELNLSADIFKNTSKMDCRFATSDNSVKCDVTCKSGYETVIPGFLSLKCYNKQWIRKNNDGKYVRLADVNSPPRCYGMCLNSYWTRLYIRVSASLSK